MPAAGDDVERSAAHLRRLVQDHPAADAREARSKERFLSELGRLPEPCDRGADPANGRQVTLSP